MGPLAGLWYINTRRVHPEQNTGHSEDGRKEGGGDDKPGFCL